MDAAVHNAMQLVTPVMGEMFYKYCSSPSLQCLADRTATTFIDGLQLPEKQHPWETFDQQPLMDLIDLPVTLSQASTC